MALFSPTFSWKSLFLGLWKLLVVTLVNVMVYLMLSRGQPFPWA